jgi:tight adherence protein C
MDATSFAVFGVFVAVAMMTGSLATWWVNAASPERRRLRNAVVQGAGSGVIVDGSPLDEQVDPRLARLSRLAPKSAKDMNRLQRKLARAGYPSRSAAVIYAVIEIAAPLVLALVALLFVGVHGWVYVLCAAAVGLILPGMFIRRRTAQRHKAIQNGLPDALDLLTVCVESGSALDQAIVRTSEELAIVHPALAEELRLITTETRAGKSRMDAFRNFAKRTGVEDVRTLVAMLIQTDRFGTSIGQALRTHADTSRTKRRQRAEERAAKVAVKLVFPLAFCLFPSLYVVCFGPVVVKIYRAFFVSGL